MRTDDCASGLHDYCNVCECECHKNELVTVTKARQDADEKYLACYAELVRVTKERDDANREAEFQHARAAKFADMLKADAERCEWWAKEAERLQSVVRAFQDAPSASVLRRLQHQSKREMPLPTPPGDPK